MGAMPQVGEGPQSFGQLGASMCQGTPRGQCRTASRNEPDRTRRSLTLALIMTLTMRGTHENCMIFHQLVSVSPSSRQRLETHKVTVSQPLMDTISGERIFPRHARAATLRPAD